MKNVTIEEKKILIKSLRESNEGDKQRTVIDYELIEGCLSIMRVHSLIPQKRRGFRVTLSEQLENLVDLAMNKEQGLDNTFEPVILNLKDVKSVISDFRITYKKSKGTTKKRIHTDNYTVTAPDEESAIITLKHRLKSLKENLISIEKISKKHFMYKLENGQTVLKSNVVDYVP